MDIDRVDSTHTTINQALKAAAGYTIPTQVKTRGQDYVHFGNNMPKLRKTMHGLKKTILEMHLSERLELAEKLHGSGVEDQAYAANYMLQLSSGELTPTQFQVLDRCLDHFRGWGVTDDFCINVLQPVLRQYPTQMLELLREWSASGNRWKRRASVVAFVRKVGASGEFTDACLERCQALIWDEDDLVRKGVGWALKDTLRGDKDKVLPYIKDLRRQGVSSVVTLYAIRDLKGAKRQDALAAGKEA